ncbi:hypothetical protein [uncultured Bacteroides sp.]|uniref:hypothetical protein n=1 Tax=uncultured Bacteroides sp. TaxID=162156 RepID=UPI0025D2A911|nr:hypothetical protein [uncultured Bacteroides sp.]
MDEKEFNSSVTAEVSAEFMQKIYLRLEDEATPHAVIVSKCRPYIKRVTIYCDSKDVAYFNTIVTDENKTEI